MRRIIQANIDRFKALLKAEIDPTRRAMETLLLVEEEAKLKALSEEEAKLKALSLGHKETKAFLI